MINAHPYMETERSVAQTPRSQSPTNSSADWSHSSGTGKEPRLFQTVRNPFLPVLPMLTCPNTVISNSFRFTAETPAWPQKVNQNPRREMNV